MLKYGKKIFESIFYDTKNNIMEDNAKVLSTALLHQKTFLPYKNYCKGEKELVVCGAGPTLQQYQPIKNAIHIGVNRAFLYDKIEFNFIFAQDYDGIRMVEEQLVNYKPEECIKFLGNQINPNKQIPESLALKCNALRFDTDGYIFKTGMKGKFVVDIERRALCNMMNVGQSVMQLALFMNPKRIYIVGCDMSGTHFAKGNQTEEQVKAEADELLPYWKKEQENLLGRWREIKECAKIYYPDTEIISINPVGLKGMFKDLYQS